MEETIRLALINENAIPNNVIQGQPGHDVFWLIEEVITCERLETFLQLLHNGQEIMWRNDDIFPFIMFYVICPFMMIKKFFIKHERD